MLYALSLAPLIGLVLLIGLIVLLVYNSRLFSDSLAYGIAGKRKKSKKTSTVLQLVIAMAAWVVALQVLFLRCNGLFCTTPQLVADNATQIAGVSPTNQASKVPLLGAANQIGNFVQTNWFYAAFFGLLVVSSVIVVRGIIVSWQQTRADLAGIVPAARAEAITSVEDAFRILKAQPESDPRTRIINCYQRMVLAAQRQGATITSDLTARQLEAAIHDMLGIKGPSMRDLTNLFEEARYSLHPITEDNAAEAQQYLLNIAQEMNFTIST